MAEVTYHFQGVNNRLDPATLGVITDPRNPTLTELVEAVNVDLGDRREVGVRSGYTLALSGAAHSGWATTDGTAAYLVTAGVLQQFSGTAVTALLTLSNNNPTVFVEVNTAVVFSNGTDIGLIDASGASLFTEPTKQFKRAMPAGHALAFYNGQLWVARDNVLTRSDAYDIEQCDERVADIPLPGPVTLLAAVKDGLWVSGGGTTAFLRDGDAEYTDYIDDEAILGTAVVGKAAWFGIEGLSGDVVVWRSTRGLCAGGESGRYVNLTEETLALASGPRGAGLLRRNQGQTHYVATIQNSGAAFNPYTPPTIPLSSTTI